MHLGFLPIPPTILPTRAKEGMQTMQCVAVLIVPRLGHEPAFFALCLPSLASLPSMVSNYFFSR